MSLYNLWQRENPIGAALSGLPYLTDYGGVGRYRGDLVGRSADYAPDLQTWGPIVVPPDSLFALGDDRDASYDCRYCGFIPSFNIFGGASVIYFSFDPNGAGPLGSRVRWHRIGQRLSSAAE